MSPRYNPEDYEPVEDRLARFWPEHEEGRILTELVPAGPGEYVFKASIWRDGRTEQLPDATGWAHEFVVEGHPVNEKSALENCETSAIGRALANLGYAPRGKRPSREEMTKASPARRSGAAAEPRRRGAVGDTPSGAAAGGSPETGAARDPAPDRTPASGSGKAATPEIVGAKVGAPAPESGEVALRPPSPGSPNYPLDPATCTHRFPSGRWLRWDDAGNCPRCGTPKVAAIEGTTADLGSA